MRAHVRSSSSKPFVLLAAVAFLFGSLAQAQTLTLAMGAQPDTLDPQATTATAAFQVMRSIYDGLLEVDQSGRIVPDLAKSYSISPDGLTYTFELNDATFHDGTAFDAADVVATLDRARDATRGSAKQVEFATITAATALDDHTVKVELSTPTPALLASLASGWGAIFPSEKLESGHDFGIDPVGTGPFKLVSWSRDNAIVLARNDDYFRGAPELQQVVIRFVTDSAVQYQGLTTGDFDVITNVPQVQYDSIEADPALTLVRQPSGTVVVGSLNARNSYLQDARVRRALNLAVDTELVLDVAYGGGNQVGTFMEYGSPWYPESVEPYGYDPEAAKALLKEAGVPDGWTIRMVLPQPYPQHIQAGQIIQDFLRDVGIKAEISIIEWGVWLSDVYNGVHDFDITVIGHTGKLDPTGRLLRGVGTDKFYTGVVDAELEQWLTTASATADQATRQQLYTNALVRMHDDPPFIYLGNPENISATRASVNGFWITPILESYNFWQVHLD